MPLVRNAIALLVSERMQRTGREVQTGPSTLVLELNLDLKPKGPTIARDVVRKAADHAVMCGEVGFERLNISVVALTTYLDPYAPTELSIRLDHWYRDDAAKEVASFIQCAQISVASRTEVAIDVA